VNGQWKLSDEPILKDTQNDFMNIVSLKTCDTWCTCK
jgi:hypothetical protein